MIFEVRSRSGARVPESMRRARVLEVGDSVFSLGSKAWQLELEDLGALEDLVRRQGPAGLRIFAHESARNVLVLEVE